ncbi:MAG: hypothetical protein EON90_06490 [Brevundimonas sp.]|nr:MAG: hypothetical protein EON90_06490 [Brevundimonas sp.]
MKPAKWGLAAAVSCAMGMSACSPSPEAKAGAAQADDGWTQPPTIANARLAGATLIIDGVAEPGARVVLRGDAGAAYAVTADEAGAFQIRIIATPDTVLLRPETQIGQDAAASPEFLLLIQGGKGPMAVLRPGQSTRRLDPAPPLGAVDSDGGQVLASGSISAPGPISAGGRTSTVSPDGQGRWSLLLEPAQAGAIQVGGRAFAWPGADLGADVTAAPQVTRAGAGWLVRWSASPGSRQSTWLPDR